MSRKCCKCPVEAQDFWPFFNPKDENTFFCFTCLVKETLRVDRDLNSKYRSLRAKSVENIGVCEARKFDPLKEKYEEEFSELQEF